MCDDDYEVFVYDRKSEQFIPQSVYDKKMEEYWKQFRKDSEDCDPLYEQWYGQNGTEEYDAWKQFKKDMESGVIDEDYDDKIIDDVDNDPFYDQRRADMIWWEKWDDDKWKYEELSDCDPFYNQRRADMIWWEKWDDDSSVDDSWECEELSDCDPFYNQAEADVLWWEEGLPPNYYDNWTIMDCDPLYEQELSEIETNDEEREMLRLAYTGDLFRMEPRCCCAFHTGDIERCWCEWQKRKRYGHFNKRFFLLSNKDAIITYLKRVRTRNLMSCDLQQIWGIISIRNHELDKEVVITVCTLLGIIHDKGICKQLNDMLAQLLR